MTQETQLLLTVGILCGVGGFVACYLLIVWWSGQVHREMDSAEDKINRQRFDENR